MKRDILIMCILLIIIYLLLRKLKNEHMSGEAWNTMFSIFSGERLYAPSSNTTIDNINSEFIKTKNLTLDNAPIINKNTITQATTNRICFTNGKCLTKENARYMTPLKNILDNHIYIPSECIILDKLYHYDINKSNTSGTDTTVNDIINELIKNAISDNIDSTNNTTTSVVNECSNSEKPLIYIDPQTTFVAVPIGTKWYYTAAYTTTTKKNNKTITESHEAVCDFAIEDQNGNKSKIFRTLSGNAPEEKNFGIKIIIPNKKSDMKNDFSVLWLKLLSKNASGTNYNPSFYVYNKTMNFGKYVSGFRRLNNISPDGSIQNEAWNLFEWYPVPIVLDESREIMISNWTNNDTWFGGFAVSTNPWNHSSVSGFTLYHQGNKDVPYFLGYYKQHSGSNQNIQLGGDENGM